MTIRLHDASDAKITYAKILGVNDKAILNLNLNKQDSTATAGKVTFDTYKYGMDNNVSGTLSYTATQKTGRLYTVELTTNIPVDSIVKTDKNTASSLADWKDVITKTGTNTFTYTIDADDSTNLANYKFLLGNRWGLYDANGPVSKTSDKSNQSTVYITPNDKSKTAISHLNPNPITGIYIKNSKELSALGLRNVTVVEPKYEVKKDDAKQPTLLNNLEESNKIQTNNKNISTSFDKTTDALTAVLTVDSSKFDKLIVTPKDGKETPGKWMLTQLYVKGNIDSFVDESSDKSAVFVDPDNSAALAENGLTYTGSSGIYQKLAVWINLSSDAIKAVTSKTDTPTTAAFEVKFSSTSPVEEHNSFFLKIIDTNTNKDLEDDDVADVTTTVDPAEYLSEAEEKKNDFAEKALGWGENKGNTLVEDDMKNIAKNMQIIQQAKVTKKVNNDTVYMTIEADFKKMQLDSGANNNAVNGGAYSFPLSFDISMLDNASSTKDVYSWGIGNDDTHWALDPNAKQLDHKTSWSTLFRFKKDGTAWNKIKNGGYTKEFLLTTENMNGVISEPCNDCTNLETAISKLKTQNAKAKYICYVVTFKQI